METCTLAEISEDKLMLRQRPFNQEAVTAFFPPSPALVWGRRRLPQGHRTTSYHRHRPIPWPCVLGYLPPAGSHLWGEGRTNRSLVVQGVKQLLEAAGGTDPPSHRRSLGWPHRGARPRQVFPPGVPQRGGGGRGEDGRVWGRQGPRALRANPGTTRKAPAPQPGRNRGRGSSRGSRPPHSPAAAASREWGARRRPSGLPGGGAAPPHPAQVLPGGRGHPPADGYQFLSQRRPFVPRLIPSVPLPKAEPGRSGASSPPLFLSGKPREEGRCVSGGVRTRRTIFLPPPQSSARGGTSELVSQPAGGGGCVCGRK